MRKMYEEMGLRKQAMNPNIDLSHDLCLLFGIFVTSADDVSMWINSLKLFE